MTVLRPALLAALLSAACSPAGPGPTDRPPAEPRARPTDGALPLAGLDVRIGLAVDVDSVVVDGTGPFELVEVDGTVLQQSAPGEPLVVRSRAGRLYASADGRRHGPLSELARVRLVPGNAGRLLLDSVPYRGSFFLLHTPAGRLTLINALDLEEYLLGVVPREMPSIELEAVKAQAVAARTYAVGHMGRRGSLGFDFHATVADQVYGGAAAEDPMASRAIRETTGEILTYDGRPILAFYHSTCGGSTAAVHEVWDRAPLPYLRSVSDDDGRGGHYCDRSNRFRWTQEWTEEQLHETLGRTLVEGGMSIDAVQDVRVLDRTPSGRIGRMRIVADGRTFEVGGDSVRRVLRTPDRQLLNSALFDVDRRTRGGEIVHLTANGGGWGHGIGMCQMGAIGRAAAGQNYRTILTTYYRGSRITTID